MILRGGHRSCNAIINICLLFFLTALPAAAYGDHFPPPVLTDRWADYLVNFKIGGVAAKPGDEVAFFNARGILCGQHTVTTYQEFIVPVYGDSLSSGEILTVRVWNAGRGVELAGNSLILTEGGGQGSFQPSSIPPIWQDQAGLVLNIDTAPHFPPPVPTRLSCHYIGALSIKGKLGAVGDEIAAFDAGGVLRGFSRIATPGYFGDMAVYGDEGAVSGSALTFKVWDNNAGIEYSGIDLTLSPGAALASYLPALIPPSWSDNAGYVLNVNVLSIPLGDVNGNGQVDLADAILALKACAGFANAADVSIMADINGDRRIGLPEVIYILQKTAQLR
jgi:hypothetical protein